MHDQFQLPPPSSWEKFERMCADIFSIEWNDPNTQRHGRTGFSQNGVDVYGRTRDGRMHGIQCKKKNLGTSSLATENELRKEVKKALKFQPPLSSFIFAATSPNDPRLESVAREITQDHTAKGLFSVHFYGWDEIVDRLSHHDGLVRRYYEWALPTADPNDFAFGLWQEQFSISYLFRNACFLPFRSLSVSFAPSFIAKLGSFYNEAAVLLDDRRTRGINEGLRNALENFNHVASDLIDNATIDASRPDADHDVHRYWPALGSLSYFQQGPYRIYKNNVLKLLFYNLITASNHIIDIKNLLSTSRTPRHSYLKYREEFYKAATECIPLYAEGQLERGILYPGIEWIRQTAAQNSIHPVREYEIAVMKMNSDHR